MIRPAVSGLRLAAVVLVVLFGGTLVAVPSGSAAENILVIADAEVSEGDPGENATMSFQISLTRGDSRPVTVSAETVLEGRSPNGATRQGTATPRIDYQPAQQLNITFQGSETTKSFRVPVLSDQAAEEDEDFFVDLYSANGASMADAQAVGTIRDDDRLGVTVADASSRERDLNPECPAMAPNGCAVFQVVLDKALTRPAAVDYETQNGTAQAGADYEASSGRVEFAPGSTQQKVAIKILRDEPPEPKETFRLKLSNPQNTPMHDGEAIGLIEDAHAVSIGDAVGYESLRSDPKYTARPSLLSGYVGLQDVSSPPCWPKPAPCATFRINLAEATNEEVAVVFKTRDSGINMGTATPGKDYEPTEEIVIFPPRVVQQFISVRVVSDQIPEPDEHFYVDLTVSKNATLEDPEARGLIKDDSVVSLREDVNVLEGTSPQPAVGAVFDVDLSGPQSVPVKVDYATHDGSAQAATNDYQPVSGTLEFAPGQMTKTVTVQVVPDALKEADEAFSLVLSNPESAVIEQDSSPRSVTGPRRAERAKATILDDDLAAEGPAPVPDDIRQKVRDQVPEYERERLKNIVPCPSPSPVAGQSASPPDAVPCGHDVYDAFEMALPPESDPPYSGQSGGVFLTGHDADLHSRPAAEDYLGENKTGAKNIVKKAVDYVTRGKSNPRLLLVMDLEGKIGKPWADPRLGISNSGFPEFDTADYGSGEPGMLDLNTVDFGNYDAVLVASGERRWFTQRELDILIRRKADLTDFVNRGGGLIAFEEGEQQWQGGKVPMQNPYGFLPCLVSTVPKGAFESGYRVSKQGKAMGLSDSDVNGNHSHTSFSHAGGFDVIDYDSEARVISVATQEGLTPEGCARLAGMAIEDTFVKEGDAGLSRAVFTIRLDRAYAQAVSVDFTTVEVDATSGLDYVPALASSPLLGSGSVRFAPGQTEKVIEIPVIGDTLTEEDETFLVRLSNAQNVKVVKDQAVGTIVDDDQPSGVQKGPGDTDRGAVVARQGGTRGGQVGGPTSQTQSHVAPAAPPQFQSLAQGIAQGQAQLLGTQVQGQGEVMLQFQSHQATEPSHLTQTQTQVAAAAQSSIAAERDRQKQSQTETLKEPPPTSNARNPQDHGKYLATSRAPTGAAPGGVATLSTALFMVASMCLLTSRTRIMRLSRVKVAPALIPSRKAPPAKISAKRRRR